LSGLDFLVIKALGVQNHLFQRLKAVVPTGPELKGIGYLSLHFSDSTSLFITEIAVCETQQGNGYGPILMRFADNLARQSDCLWVRLNAIENKIGFYEGFGYKKIPGREPIKLDGEVYYPMEHRVMSLPFTPV
jgi:ribosomal protein S18 acetylase RimI-like enzyme